MKLYINKKIITENIIDSTTDFFNGNQGLDIDTSDINKTEVPEYEKILNFIITKMPPDIKAKFYEDQNSPEVEQWLSKAAYEYIHMTKALSIPEDSIDKYWIKPKTFDLNVSAITSFDKLDNLKDPTDLSDLNLTKHEDKFLQDVAKLNYNINSKILNSQGVDIEGNESESNNEKNPINNQNSYTSDTSANVPNTSSSSDSSIPGAVKFGAATVGGLAAINTGSYLYNKFNKKPESIESNNQTEQTRRT